MEILYFLARILFILLIAAVIIGYIFMDEPPIEPTEDSINSELDK